MRSLEVNPSEITTNSLDEQFVKNVLKVVEENMSNPDFSVEQLCELASIARTTLHNKLKSLVGQSATEFINSVRVKRAAQLIKQKAGTVSEIAYDVGFNSLSYFTKVFKRHFGELPSELH
ncbi:MAG TPA: helix-turn-helix transcriptional regulator [Tenuifilaceae bacterium]|nr:helix-turn-helix transcriptional regulator [Tenuifilaceae bacterium]